MEEDDMMGTKLVVIGGSAGSLEVLIKMLQEVGDVRIPIIVVIHRKGTLHSALAELLNFKTPIVVKEAEEKEPIVAGHLYLAPADYHLLIEKDGTLSLDYSEKVNFSRPSIDVTFECAAQVYGAAVIGILLSGGNSDGVEGLKAIKRAGGVCAVQHPESALVSFMPQHAVNELEVDYMLRDSEIAAFLDDIA